MEFFKPGLYIDFMRVRWINIGVSLSLIVLSTLVYFFPGPKWGVDFKGGTELQVAFQGNISPAEVRATLKDLGHDDADVVSVEGHANEYILRVQEVSSLPKALEEKLRQRIRAGIANVAINEDPKFSPGGDKVSIRATDDIDPEAIRTAIADAGGRVRDVTRFGSMNDHRFEVQLVGLADEIVHGLQVKLGDKAPTGALRVEWVGPRAGAQLRNAGLMSLAYAIVFIMIYIAVRFDVRFAPGGVIAMVHDGVITAGVLIVARKEITLTTVAAILTIIGYSINDTVVVYDRIRENLTRRKGKSLIEVINISTSETLSRTILTSAISATSMIAFLFFGTPVIKDFAETMLIGIVVGTYSSIYVAAPITEYIDSRFFRVMKKKGAASGRARAATA